jgi:hypothetical protein
MERFLLHSAALGCIIDLSTKGGFPMDIKAELKEKIEEIVEKIKADKDIAAKFQKDPVTTVGVCWASIFPMTRWKLLWILSRPRSMWKSWAIPWAV